MWRVCTREIIRDFDKRFTTTLKPADHLHVPRSQLMRQERLKSLICQAPVMLFMKGNPETPRCGFSRRSLKNGNHSIIANTSLYTVQRAARLAFFAGNRWIGFAALLQDSSSNTLES